MVIISSAVYCASDMTGGSFETPLKFAEILGAEHVPVDPCLKALALPRNIVPSFVERVVALVITLRVGRKRAAFHFTHCTENPRRQHYRVRRGLQIAHNFLHRDDGALRGQNGLLLDAHHAPHQDRSEEHTSEL